MPTRIRLEDRDLAHERDMAQLRREQLRADFDDEELADLDAARELDDRLEDVWDDWDDPEFDLQASDDANAKATFHALLAGLERPELRQHALDCGLDMTGAFAIHVDDAMAVYGWPVGHDVLHPETQRVFVKKGECIYFFVLDALKAAGIDYFTINPEL